MPREKIRRTEKTVGVDMIIVKKLTDWRDSINQKAEQTGLFCNLFPDMNKKVCKQCPEKKCELCLKHEREREFIHAQEATKGNKRRERKQTSPKIVGPKEFGEATEEDEEFIDNYAEEEPIKEPAGDKRYPCYPMEYACPKKDECNCGENCPYGDSVKESSGDNKYPCYPMEYACPKKDECNYGEKCPYRSKLPNC